ncbi:MAG: hypothetical protein PHH57_05105 [Candidatus Omnitrophica bacterium]|nr:hypothetical protein [Candidatus Omnitrophota bacterium]
MNWDDVLFSVSGGTGPIDIKPGETITVDFAWDQKDEGGRQVQPGWYNVIFGEITVRQENSSYTFNPGANILIQYPQGVMEKSFDLDQSRTVSGVTMTLKHVELTTESASFSFFFIPPGYTASPSRPGMPPIPPIMSIMAKAEYTVNGATKYAGTAGFKTQGDGIGLIWGGGPGKLDPVPSDAKEMTFTITQLNDWEGPWIFQIPLQ